MAKTLQFPSSHKSYTELARLSSEKDKYDDAVFYAYKAYKAGADEQESILFMARQLAMSENFYDALRLVYRYYPDAKKRPLPIMNIIRDCMYGIHEYMHAHHIEGEIVKRSEKISTSEVDDSVESFLSQFDLMLNDTVAFGCDCSSLTETWADVRPIMSISAVHNAFYSLADGRFSHTLGSMKPAMKHAIMTDEYSIAEEYLAENSSMLMVSAALSGNVEDFTMCMGALETMGDNMPRSLSYIATYALFAKIVNKEGPDFAEMPNDPTSSREELLSIVYTLVLAGEKEKAYEQMKRLYPYAEYNIGINRLYASIAIGNGDTKAALTAYERIHKLVPWESAEDFYRTQILHSINDENAALQELPITVEDRDAAGKHGIDQLAKFFNNPLENVEELLTDDLSEKFCAIFPALKQKTQLDIVRQLSASRDEKVIRFLQRILLDSCSDSDAKSAIVKIFSRMPEKTSVVACASGNFVEAYPRMHTRLPMPNEYYEQYKRCYNIAVRTYGEICALAVNYYYEYFSKFCFSDPEFYEEPDMSESFAAVVLSMAVQMCGFGDNEEDILDKIYTEIDMGYIEETTDFIESCERGYLYDLYGDM